jgi:hypothetical protein
VSAAEILLVLIAGWTALSLVAAVAVIPLFRASRRSDDRMEPPAPRPPVPARLAGEAGAAAKPAPSALRESGYPAIVLERLVLHASTIFGADEVCVFGVDARARHDSLLLLQGAGVDPDLIGQRLAIEWDPMVAALACGRPLAVPGELWPAWHGGAEPAHSAAMAPIWFAGRVQGALTVIHRRGPAGLDVPGLAFLGELAELAGQVLAHTQARQLAAADPQPEIDGLTAALARIRSDGAGHGAEVAAIAGRLGDDLGLGDADRIELELGARLHDAGKLRVPADVLDGTARLTPANGELLRLQPLWGAEMVARIPGLEAIALIVRLVHERWDGRGYPDGLAAERIPLASRIIALADLFSTMTAPAPYGRALDPATALHELDALAGTRFDPDLIARLVGAVSGVPAMRHG